MQKTKENELGLLEILSAYTKISLHLIRRIDTPVSGLVIIAKSKEAAAKLSAALSQESAKKQYLAIVEKADIPNEAEITHYLRKRGGKTFVSNKEEGKKATLHYQVFQTLENYLILKIKAETGRFHQIRAQLSAIGSPVKGDVKYGARRSNPDRSILLHAWKLSYKDPFNKESVEWEAPLPKETLWDFLDKDSL